MAVAVQAQRARYARSRRQQLVAEGNVTQPEVCRGGIAAQFVSRQRLAIAAPGHGTQVEVEGITGAHATGHDRAGTVVAAFGTATGGLQAQAVGPADKAVLTRHHQAGFIATARRVAGLQAHLPGIVIAQRYSGAGIAVERHTHRSKRAANSGAIEPNRLRPSDRLKIAGAPLHLAAAPCKTRHTGLRIGGVGTHSPDRRTGRLGREHIWGVDDEAALDKANPAIGRAA